MRVCSWIFSSEKRLYFFFVYCQCKFAKTQGYAGKQGADLLLLGHGACSFVEILREIYTPIFLMPHSRTELPPVRRAGLHSECAAERHPGGLFPAAALQNCGSDSGGFKAFRRFPVFGKPTPIELTIDKYEVSSFTGEEL